MEVIKTCIGSWLASCPTGPKKPKRGKSLASAVSSSISPLLLVLVLCLVDARIALSTSSSHSTSDVARDWLSPSSYRHHHHRYLRSVHGNGTEQKDTIDKYGNEALQLQITGKNDDGRQLQQHGATSAPSSAPSSNVFTLQDINNQFCQQYCVQNPTGQWITAVPNAVQYLLIILLICLSALSSGLTLGLMGLDKTGLEIVMDGDDPVEAAAARKIYTVRKNGNLLLCTLLLLNVAVNALLSILLADKAGGLAGFLGSTGLIVIVGEILPQALCSRYALRIGSFAVPLVRVIIVIIYPVAAPLAFLLDLALGQELATTYSSAEMLKLLQIHVQEEALDKDTAVAMTGALKYKDMAVSDVMTPLKHTFMLSVDEKLNFETIATIFKTGYSRIPVYEVSKNNIIGLLFVKDLIFIDPEDETPVRNFVQIFGRGVHIVWPGDKLGDVLRELKQGRSHMALVRDVVSDGETDPYYEVKGIITLEDIIEEILGHEIVDETDAFVDGSHAVTVNRAEGFEMAKLRLLGSKIVDEKLSHTEIKAITAHLRANYPRAVDLLTDNQLERLVADTRVTVLPTATRELGKELPNELMYEKGVPSDVCTLILSGKVTVITGADNFRTDVSSWTLLGVSALRDPEYKPDFTAFVCNGPCRCLQFTRENFRYALDASASERRAAQEDQSHNLGQDPSPGSTRPSESAVSPSPTKDGASEVTSENSESGGNQIERALRMEDRRSKLMAALHMSKDSSRESGTTSNEEQQTRHTSVGFGAGPRDVSTSSTNSSLNEALGLGLYHPKRGSDSDLVARGPENSETQDATASSSIGSENETNGSHGPTSDRDAKRSPSSNEDR